MSCELYHLRDEKEDRTLCGRRFAHDEFYVSHEELHKNNGYKPFGSGVLIPMPVESFGKESPDNRWYPCCKFCLKGLTNAVCTRNA